ncbi:protein-(glutamine-N5) methyltransferase, release factor-specific [Virgibacillus profundi]|uniref:Release factor glutamine methyltransferase n=1 Tax=Virgibacillus profundi TaxID=2024555 RepID=A0A2A2IJT8_9BACI|nr:peptide chain release factor N(5)-glutamine methyltransferase [Virgibacillus profundi]PAV31373.1 protein-(glutamine-N5) methyltransferase, release factor-specific [Virgibacillus profundi]PXY55559.1 peptide chain release factor N(5)-glutamine methyltransferase [Virgibacillus profundi]
MIKTKQYEVLQWASLFLEKHNRESRVAEILLQHHLQVTRSQFHMMMRDSITDEVIDRYKADILKHAETGIPVQHLMGYETFYGRKFFVNEHVLVPRPETEELVQHVIELGKWSNIPHPRIADIGTGSGIIAITLALELPDATIYATDISEEALKMAEHNAETLQADVIFRKGDFLKPLIDEEIIPDIIVSNPPYIAKSEEDSLSETVKNFDPELALFAEEDGLAAYKKIIDQSQELIKSKAAFAFEIGFEQGKAVSGLIKNVYPSSDVEILQDINKKDRIISAIIK